MPNVPLPDAELDRLLHTLLRMVSADAAADGVTPAALAGLSTTNAIPELSSSEARALIELGTAHGIAQGELAGLLGLQKSTVSRLAAGLEHKGWIRRGRDPGDQRYVRLYLTAEGSVVARQVWQLWESRHARILAGLSAEERAGLASGLRGLARGFAAEHPAADTEAPGRPVAASSADAERDSQTPRPVRKPEQPGPAGDMRADQPDTEPAARLAASA